MPTVKTYTLIVIYGDREIIHCDVPIVPNAYPAVGQKIEDDKYWVKEILEHSETVHKILVAKVGCDWEPIDDQAGLLTVYKCKNCGRRTEVRGDFMPPVQKCRKSPPEY
ncbi:MAG TPA: hypothetical protein VN788_07330 [Verrucomicrobiae bacterium]|nr:hypothetical protein [Verrucomicrobiae bacterium]HXU49046.1 hypothetical protein [Candidatus Binatia bacterium]